MNIIKDFFFTSWGNDRDCPLHEASDSSKLGSALDKDEDRFCDCTSIILTISDDNISKYLSLDSVMQAINYLHNPDSEIDRAEIHMLQCKILTYLMHLGNPKLNKKIGYRIEKLRKATIIGYSSSRKLISTLTLIKEKQPKEMAIEDTAIEIASDGAYYEKKVSLIENLVMEATKYTQAESLKSRLCSIPAKIKDQKFSIGITGVMNAGKSTMLNALLGKELLGTSVVPETANLTIIKYAKSPRAIVHFWSSDEWDRIEKSADTISSIDEFVRQTRDHFGDRFEKFVTKDGKQEESSIDTLPSYTSAEHSDKVCNLVKSVELYSDLEFVQNGVEIVDTPGLDDPVIQREEITTAYLDKCDLLCHLMNVNQSATKKDVEFIVDSLLYRNISQLLVVITRIDTVSEDELQEVIQYTKSSIQTKLESLGKGRQFDELVSRIEFIPISARTALLHRVGKSSQIDDSRYNIQNCGILEIERYLRDVLFGSDSIKAQLIIDASTKEFLSATEEQIQLYKKELDMLSKSTQELAQEYKIHQATQEQAELTVQKLNSKIEQGRDELVAYFEILAHFITNKLTAIKSIIQRRVTDDVSYELRKNRKKPSPDRVDTIIETAMRDGLIDIIREYRYLFQKKLDELLEKIEREFDEFDMVSYNNTHNAKELLSRHFDKLILSGSHQLLAQQINKAISKTNKKNLEVMNQEIQSYLEEAMIEIEQTFTLKIEEFNAELLSGFESRCKEPLERTMQALQNQSQILQNVIDASKNSATKSSQRDNILKTNIAKLKNIQNMIEKGDKI